MYPSIHEEKIGYVYVLISANREFLKFGKSYCWSNLRARVQQLGQAFLADYAESICFRFETEAQAKKAENALKDYLGNSTFESPITFGGHTEMCWGSQFVPILVFMLNQRFEGFISMNDLWSELEMDDYAPPSKMTFVTSPTKMSLGVIRSRPRSNGKPCGDI